MLAMYEFLSKKILTWKCLRYQKLYCNIGPCIEKAKIKVRIGSKY